MKTTSKNEDVITQKMKTTTQKMKSTSPKMKTTLHKKNPPHLIEEDEILKK